MILEVEAEVVTWLLTWPPGFRPLIFEARLEPPEHA